MRVRPKKVPDKDRPGQFCEDYWDEAKKLMIASSQLKEDLINYDKEQITLEMVTKLQKYIDEPWFTASEMAKKSRAASGLCAFVTAMHQFYFVNQNVIPRRQKQAQAQAELDVVDKKRQETESQLRAISQNIATLKQ